MSKVATLLAFALVSAALLPAQSLPPAKKTSASVEYSKLPLAFEPNRGQTSGEAQFLARGPRSTIFLTGPDAVLKLTRTEQAKQEPGQIPARSTVSSAALRMHLIGAAQPEAMPEEKLPGEANYFTGNDRSHWQTNVPTYAQVRLPAVYPGVDLLYYGHAGQLEYDFIVAPGAEASAIRLSFDGGQPMLGTSGDLSVAVADSRLTFGRPIVYQNMAGRRVSVEGAFALAANTLTGKPEISFHLGAYDHSLPLIIDPVLIYEGSIGQGLDDTLAGGIATDASGALYITGTTAEPGFPTTTGAYQTNCGTPNAAAAAVGRVRCGEAYGSSLTDAFVTKISPDGTTLIYSTYLHGSGGDEVGSSIAVDSTGIAYLLGTTSSNDFPITADALQSYCAPQYPITGQNAGGQATYGPETSECDNNYVGSGGGSSYTVHDPGSLYLVKLNAAGSALLYGTFFGGSEGEYPTGLALDSANNMLVSHYTIAHSGPSLYPTPGVVGLVNPLTTTNAYQNTAADEIVGMLTKLSNDGHSLLYSTFLAGASGGNGGTVQTLALSVAAGQSGVAFLGGYTMSSSFPVTPGALKTQCVATTGYLATYNCQTYYGFVTAFNTTASAGPASLVYSTYLGGDTAPGSNSDVTQVNGLIADSSNDVIAAGYTYTSDYPTTPGAYQTTCVPAGHGLPSNNCDVSFISKLNPTGSGLLWSSFYQGAQGLTQAMSVATDPKGDVVLSGYAQHGFYSIPVVNQIVPSYGGDAPFVAVFNPTATQLLFSNAFGSANNSTVVRNGVAADAAGNIYFVGNTQDALAANNVTPGAYTQPLTGGYHHFYFGKISPIKPVSTTTITVSPASTSTTQSVTFNATVAGATTSPTPTGSVVFKNTAVTPAVTLGTALLGAGGSGSFSTKTLAAGTYTVVGSYSSDTNYDYSTSAAQTLTIVTGAPDNLTLTTSSAAVNAGAGVTFTATAKAGSGSAQPTGTVMFYDGATLIGTGMLTIGASGSVATYTTSSLGVGNHSISASYLGDNTFAAASTATAQTETISANTASLTFTATPTTAVAGASVSLTAATSTAAGAPAPTGVITFLDGSTVIGSGTIAAGAVNFSSTSLAVGTHVLSASYAGDSNYAKQVSSTITITITAVGALSATTTTVTSSALSASLKSTVTLTATVASTATIGSPTGSVIFYDGTTALGTGTVSAKTATLAVSTLAAGTHSITAVYSGDGSFLTSTSPAITQTIVASLLTIAATPNPLNITHGQSGNVTFAFTPSGGYAGTVSVTCGALPAHATCAFSSPSLTFTATSSAVQSLNLTISTQSAVAALHLPNSPASLRRRADVAALALSLPVGLFSLLGLTRGRRLSSRLRNHLTIALFSTTLVATAALSGCGGSSPLNSTPVGTYTITVTVADVVNGNQSIPVTVVVQ